jgi:hypothetical protein
VLYTPPEVAKPSPLCHQRDRAQRAIRGSPNALRELAGAGVVPVHPYGSELEHRRCRTEAKGALPPGPTIRWWGHLDSGPLESKLDRNCSEEAIGAAIHRRLTWSSERGTMARDLVSFRWEARGCRLLAWNIRSLARQHHRRCSLIVRAVKRQSGQSRTGERPRCLKPRTVGVPDASRLAVLVSPVVSTLLCHAGLEAARAAVTATPPDLFLTSNASGCA